MHEICLNLTPLAAEQKLTKSLIAGDFSQLKNKMNGWETDFIKSNCIYFNNFVLLVYAFLNIALQRDRKINIANIIN